MPTKISPLLALRFALLLALLLAAPGARSQGFLLGLAVGSAASSGPTPSSAGGGPFVEVCEEDDCQGGPVLLSQSLVTAIYPGWRNHFVVVDTPDKNYVIRMSFEAFKAANLLPPPPPASPAGLLAGHLRAGDSFAWNPAVSPGVGPFLDLCSADGCAEGRALVRAAHVSAIWGGRDSSGRDVSFLRAGGSLFSVEMPFPELRRRLLHSPSAK